jgi:hypothetical protein
MYSQLLSSRRAMMLGLAALLLEALLIFLPSIDKLADKNPTVHFTQHGGIFLGGVLMGIALRDMHLASHV